VSEAPMIQAKIDTSRLAPAIRDYQLATGKTMAEVIEKKIKSLGIEIYRHLRDQRTTAGQLKAQLYSRLADRLGVKVRDSIRQKSMSAKSFGKSSTGRKLNWWQLAMRKEIAARASAGGFLAFSAHFKPGSGSSVSTVFSRYSKMLSTMVIKTATGDPAGILSWPGMTTTGAKAVEGLETARQAGAIQAGINSETRDIVQYVSNLLQSKYNTMAQT